MAAASFPGYPVTGAVFHFIRTPGTNPTIYYLGTCEDKPEIMIHEYHRPVMNDEAGKMLPGQKTDQGQRADVGLTLTRYSEQAYFFLRTIRGEGNGLQVADGQAGRFSRGSLIFGSKTFELWQVFENSLNATFRGNQPIGYYWPQAELVDHGPVRLGTQEKVLQLVLDCQPWKVPQASISAVTGFERSWVLYQQDDDAFPSDVLVPQ